MSSLNVLNDTLEYIRTEKTILFFGAGLSCIAGCPSWSVLLNDIVEHPQIKPYISDFMELKRICNNSYPLILEYCKKQCIGNNIEHAYNSIMDRAFYYDHDKYKNDYMPLLEKILQIKPFPKIITTNIDDCLENTRLFDLSKSYYRLNEIDTSILIEGSITHIHGFRNSIDESILAQSQYINRYIDHNFISFLEKIFTDFTVIFIGYSLGDKELSDIIMRSFNKVKSKHYLLLPSEEFNDIKKDYYKINYGIDLIDYGNRDKLSDELGYWIDSNFPKKGSGVI